MRCNSCTCPLADLYRIDFATSVVHPCLEWTSSCEQHSIYFVHGRFCQVQVHGLVWHTKGWRLAACLNILD